MAEDSPRTHARSPLIQGKGEGQDKDQVARPGKDITDGALWKLRYKDFVPSKKTLPLMKTFR